MLLEQREHLDRNYISLNITGDMKCSLSLYLAQAGTGAKYFQDKIFKSLVESSEKPKCVEVKWSSPMPSHMFWFRSQTLYAARAATHCVCRSSGMTPRIASRPAVGVERRLWAMASRPSLCTLSRWFFLVCSLVCSDHGAKCDFRKDYTCENPSRKVWAGAPQLSH